MCVEDEPATVFVGDTDRFGNDGFEVSVLVPNPAVSKAAVVEARVVQDNLAVWSDEQKVRVEGRSES